MSGSRATPRRARPGRGSGEPVLGRIWVVMATGFVDMIGYLMVLPLLPFYAEGLGAGAFEVGALISAFALAQVSTAPLWGRLSDRWGRRPVLIAGLGLSATAYLLFGVANALWVLLLSRLVQGGGGGTIGVVQAYVTDAVHPDDRTRALGWLSAATSAGVMVGPVLGSWTAHWGQAVPGFVASGLCVLNVLFAARWLRELRPRESGVEGPPRRRLRESLAGLFARPGHPAHRLIWIYATGMMAFMAMNGVLALYLERRFGISEHNIGYLYLYVGAVSLVMRGALLGYFLRWLGDVGVLRLGAFGIALGLGLLPLPGSILGLGGAITLIPVGTALLFPATTSLVSSHAPPGQVGQTLGVQQALGGVARMLGPIWAGAAFDALGMGVPFWLASGLMVVATAVTLLWIRKE